MFCSSASCESAMIGSCRLLLTAFLHSRMGEPASAWDEWPIFWGAEELLNAWCEMRSPLEQVSEGQPRTTKLVVEPDAEVVQRNPGRQASPQPAQLMGSLRAK